MKKSKLESIQDVFRHVILDNGELVREGFASVKRTTSEACSLTNAVGKRALFAFVEIAKWIVNISTKRNSESFKILNTSNGEGIEAIGVDLNVYKMGIGLCKTFTKKSDWPPPFDMGVGETRIPDVLSELCSKDIHGQVRKKYVIIGEVKSSAEVRSTTEVDRFHKAWRQALIGLIDSRYTYGILFQPQKCVLFELKVTKTSKGGSRSLHLNTLKETFSFYEGPVVDDSFFVVDSALSLLKKIIAIFVQLL